MGDESISLFVRNVPLLPKSAIVELFSHYKSSEWIPVSSGKCWILKFRNENDAKVARSKLDNLTVNYLLLDIFFFFFFNLYLSF